MRELYEDYWSSFYSLWGGGKRSAGTTLTLGEAVLCAWPFGLFAFAYAHFFHALSLDSWPGRLVFVWAILKWVFFPVTEWVWCQILVRYFELWGRYFFGHGHDPLAEQMVIRSLTSHWWLLFPVLGPFLQGLFRWYVFWKGLRNDYELSTANSLLVLTAPSLILFLSFLGLFFIAIALF